MRKEIAKDIFIIFASILVAIVFVKSGFFESNIFESPGLSLLGSFIAGIFFTSIFTTVPATAVLIELSLINPPVLVALFGAIGSLLGDFLILKFMRDRLSVSLVHFVGIERNERFKKIFKLRYFRWILGFIGALVVASPLPDELGLALMGFSQMKNKVFVPLSLSLNFVGILAISLIARGFFS